jgi:hypothetical protein
MLDNVSALTYTQKSFIKDVLAYSSSAMHIGKSQMGKLGNMLDELGIPYTGPNADKINKGLEIYHGTHYSTALQSILRFGFMPSPGLVGADFGPGVYVKSPEFDYLEYKDSAKTQHIVGASFNGGSIIRARLSPDAKLLNLAVPGANQDPKARDLAQKYKYSKDSKKMLDAINAFSEANGYDAVFGVLSEYPTEGVQMCVKNPGAMTVETWGKMLYNVGGKLVVKSQAGKRKSVNLVVGRDEQGYYILSTPEIFARSYMDDVKKALVLLCRK